MENQPPSEPQGPEEERKIDIEGLLEERRRDPNEVAQEDNIPEKGTALHTPDEELAYKLETIERTRRLIERLPEGSTARAAMEKALIEMESDSQPDTGGS